MGVRPTPSGPDGERQHPRNMTQLGTTGKGPTGAKRIEDPPEQWQFKRKLWLCPRRASFT